MKGKSLLFLQYIVYIKRTNFWSEIKTKPKSLSVAVMGISRL